MQSRRTSANCSIFCRRILEDHAPVNRGRLSGSRPEEPQEAAESDAGGPEAGRRGTAEEAAAGAPEDHPGHQPLFFRLRGGQVPPLFGHHPLAVSRDHDCFRGPSGLFRGLLSPEEDRDPLPEEHRRTRGQKAGPGGPAGERGALPAALRTGVRRPFFGRRKDRSDPGGQTPPGRGSMA